MQLTNLGKAPFPLRIIDLSERLLRTITCQNLTDRLPPIADLSAPMVSSLDWEWLEMRRLGKLMKRKPGEKPK